MTTISSTDHTYDAVEFTMGMESGRFFTSKAEDFEKKAEKKDCFERIPDDKPVKFYFDIDHKFPTEGLDMGADVLKEKADGVIQIYNKYLIELFADWVPQVVPIINFGESHFEHKMVGDVDKWGLSFHVVVLNICAYKNMIGDMAGIFNDHIMDDQNSGRSLLFTTYLPSFSEAFDTKVYSAGKQKIRCIHASKEDEKRPFRLQKGTFEDMMITAFIPPDAITLEDRKEASIETVKTTVGETRKKSPHDAVFVQKCFDRGMFFNDSKSEGWYKVGFFLKGYFGDNEESYALFDTFSLLCPAQYNRLRNREKWDGFEVKGEKYDSFGIFMNWAKKDNSVLCKQITEELKTLKRDEKSKNREIKADAKKETSDNCNAIFATLSAEFEKTHTKIINDSVFVKQLEDRVIIMSKKELITSYEHMQCGVNSCNNPVSFILKWTSCNDNINKKDSMQIYPNAAKCPENVFNLWRPFAMEILTSPYEKHTGGLDIMLKHINIL